MKKILLICLLSLVSFSAYSMLPPKHGTITITAAGATDRTQGNDETVTACTFLADSGNSGAVYLGNFNVTNSSGTSQGIKLNPGESLSNFSLSNIKFMYFAADNANDAVHFICS